MQVAILKVVERIGDPGVCCPTIHSLAAGTFIATLHAIFANALVTIRITKTN